MFSYCLLFSLHLQAIFLFSFAGWTRFENQEHGSTLAYLAKNCPELRKLILTAVRCVSNNELLALAKYNTNLEQLDLLNSSSFKVESLIALLDSCVKLTFLDISFCNNISISVYQELCKRYPHCTIKKSFTP